MKFSRKRIIWTVIIAAIVLLIGVSVTRKPKITYETEKVVRGEVVEEVSVTGSLAPTQKIALEPETSGRVVKVSVESGAEVKAGTVLVELDSRDVQSKIVSQRAAVESARARLNELAAGSTPQELAVAQTAVDTAVTKRDSAIAAKADAELALATAKANAETQSAGKLQALLLSYDKAVSDANDALTRASARLFFLNTNDLSFEVSNVGYGIAAEDSRALATAASGRLTTAVSSVGLNGTAGQALGVYPSVVADLGVIKAHLEADRTVLDYAYSLSSETLAEYRAGVSSALSNLSLTMQDVERSRNDLLLQLNGTEVNAAQAALTAAAYSVQTAESALLQAKADLTLRQSGTRPEVIASQRAQVEVQEAALTGYYTEASKRRITAPIDGIVTDVAVELGETVSPGKVAVSLQTKGNFEITTNISEIDIGKVAVGDVVSITLDAFPKTEKWSGKVVKIDPAEKVVEGVIFYETTVVFDAEDVRLRSGMTANLTIETEKKTEVLRIPLRGLREVDGKTTLKVLRNGVAEEVDVVVGLQNNTHAELISGLSENDEVIVGETK